MAEDTNAKNASENAKKEKKKKAVSPEKQKKRKKVYKILSWVGMGLGALAIILIILLVIYVQTHKMDKAKTFIVNDASLEKKLLIATQGSDFKDALSKAIIDKLWKNKVYIKATDVSELSTIEPQKWSAIIIVNSVEAATIHKAAMSFLSKVKNKNKVLVVATSGSGKHKPKNVDVDTITCASKQSAIENVTNKIMSKITPELKKE